MMTKNNFFKITSFILALLLLSSLNLSCADKEVIDEAGVGDMPIWIYFDGNGYSKPASMSAEDYVNELKCQIYTSIIHGATGVMFWSDTTKEPYVFDALTPMLKELNDNVHIFKLNTSETAITGDLHIMIKEDKDKKYIIASNTSKSSPVSLNIAGADKKSLNALEVYVGETLTRIK